MLGEVAACRCFATRRERVSLQRRSVGKEVGSRKSCSGWWEGEKNFRVSPLCGQGSSSSAAPMQLGPSSRGAVGRGRCVSDPPVMRL